MPKDTNYWRDSYWPRRLSAPLSRRALLKGAALGAGLAAFPLAGCGKDSETTAGSTPAPAGTPRPGGRMTVGVSTPISSMDPALWTGGGDKNVVYNNYDWPTTLDYDETNNLVFLPCLAETWEWPDLSTLIMHWRKGVKFHDGTGFTADAVQEYYKRVLNPELASPRVAELRPLDHTEKIDDYTTKYILKEPDAVFLLSQSFWTSEFPSPTAVAKYGDDYANHPVGTGPFVFKSQQEGASVELEKNPNYWRPGEPLLDGYSVRIIPDLAVTAAALESGEIDFTANLNPEDVIRFQKDSRFNVSIAGAQSSRLIYVHKKKELGKNPHLRKAISLAINRDEFVARYNGLSFKTAGPMVKNGIWGNPNQPDPEFNLDLAKQELAAAGFANGVTINAKTTTDPLVQADAEQLTQQLAKIGITVKWEFIPTQAGGSTLAFGTYEFLLGGWPGPGGDYLMRNVYHSKGAYNAGSLSDPDVDKLIDDAKLVADIQKRKELYWQAEKIIMDNFYNIWIMGFPEINVMRKNVQGFIPSTEPGGTALQLQWRKFWRSA